MVSLREIEKESFKPRKFELIFDIDTEEELNDFREEFISGQMDNIITDYSTVLFVILQELKKI